MFSEPTSPITLRKDLHQLNPDHFGSMKDLFATARSGRTDFLILACSDHGTAPDMVSFAHRHQCLIIQNLGASVPTSADPSALPTVASLEIAICLYEIRHVIICGHLGCGIIANWINPQAESAGTDKDFDRDTAAFVKELYPHASMRERFHLAIREHIVCQLENLQTHRFVQSRLDDGLIHLHGWIVDDHSARVRRFDPITGQFLPA